jgi:hypothetical protein
MITASRAGFGVLDRSRNNSTSGTARPCDDAANHDDAANRIEVPSGRPLLPSRSTSSGGPILSIVMEEFVARVAVLGDGSRSLSNFRVEVLQTQSATEIDEQVAEVFLAGPPARLWRTGVRCEVRRR